MPATVMGWRPPCNVFPHGSKEGVIIADGQLPPLSSKSSFALQQALSNLPGRHLDAYFELLDRGSVKLEALTRGMVSIPKRAQALIALAKEQGRPALLDIAEQFLVDIDAKHVFVDEQLQKRVHAALEADNLVFKGGELMASVQSKAKIGAKSRPITSSKETGVNNDIDIPASAVNPRWVFLVQGRNNVANAALTDYLTALDLRVLDWEEVVGMTGETNPYIGDVITKGMAVAQAVVVLFTPDDKVKLDVRLTNDATPGRELEDGYQPRPNVLIEAGMALARNANRTVIVQWGDIRPATDLDGKHLFRVGQGTKWRHDLKNRLRSAGLKIDDSSGRYMDAGTFPTAFRSGH